MNEISGIEGYQSWRALSSALNAAAKAQAGQRGSSVADLVRGATFDRFLSRVFADGEDSAWLLKGGSSILARVPRSRSTVDVDLAAAGTSIDDAIAALEASVGVDLGDHLMFTLARVRPIGAGEGQQGSQMRRLLFDAHDPATGRRVGQVPVDLVIEPAPTGPVEVVEPANRLPVPRSVPCSPYRLFPLVDHIADKVCAVMATNYPGGRPSSRVKDLVDLVVIATTQRVDLDQLRIAIVTEAAFREMSVDRFQIPAGWGPRYATLAATTPAVPPELRTAGQAEEFVATFINPALKVDPTSGAGTSARTWVAGQGWV